MCTIGISKNYRIVSIQELSIADVGTRAKKNNAFKVQRTIVFELQPIEN